jgi:hypothetical protein
MLNKIPEKINLKEEKFILTKSFRGYHLWSFGSIVSGSGEPAHHKSKAHIIADRKERERSRQGPTPFN